MSAGSHKAFVLLMTLLHRGRQLAVQKPVQQKQSIYKIITDCGSGSIALLIDLLCQQMFGNT
jgi:hypothetical protein